MRNHPAAKKSSRPAGTSRSHRQQKTDRLNLYGIHTVGEALLNDNRKKYRLLVTRNAALRLERQIARAPKGLEILEATIPNISDLVGADAVHQGVVLECDPLAPKNLADIEPGAKLLVLDQISDPHNAGAIMRSCVAMGVTTLIATSRNAAPQSPVLAKSASGALDLIDIVEVSNLSKAITTLNAQGYLTIGLDSVGPQNLESAIADNPRSAPIALVLGAEGRGLRQQTREACSALARLDMPGKIKSLNVSNAAALALYIAHRHDAIRKHG